jgi:hypothetical protein
VIRFNCPHCGRFYELPDYMHLLPLICKGCYQRLEAPPPGAAPEPVIAAVEPAPPLASAAPAPNKPVVEPARTATPPVQPVEEKIPLAATESVADSGDQLLSAKALQHLEATTATLAPPLPKSKPAEDEGEPPPSEPPGRSRVLAIAADVAVMLALLVVGVLLGEVLAHKSTREVFDNADAPTFPPTDLLLWLSPLTILWLAYGMQISRGKSLGAWLQRRAETAPQRD